MYCILHFDFVQLSDDIIMTIGNQYELIQHHCYYDLRKYYFSNHAIPMWSNLSLMWFLLKIVNTFKNHLDKFWSNPEVLYDYVADTHGIENHTITT